MQQQTVEGDVECTYVLTYLVYGTLMTLICVQILSTEKKEKMLKIDK